jgi:hypothetical protein
MHEGAFDQFARNVARGRVSRRTLMKRGVTSVAVAIVAGSLRAAGSRAAQTAATPSPGTPVAQTEGTSLCHQTYALCTGAPCEQPKSGATVTPCRCHVLDGYNIGYSTCEERVPSGRKLLSTFSTQNVTNSTSAIICPEASPWANCLDMLCEIDANDPKAATCQCPIVNSGPWVTFDFNPGCDMSMCTSGIWSAATLTLPVASIYESEMKKLGQKTQFPAACPAATPLATPAPAS